MRFDLVIKNGTVIDPERGKTTVAHLGIKEGSIQAITREEISANQVINARGKIVCPGFIDMHAHVEGNESCAKVLVAMGVTTVYSGSCGMGVANLRDFFAKYEREGFLIHQIEQKGHTFLRESVGITNRYQAAHQEEIEKMKVLLEQDFDEGAYGLSFGLEYVPGASVEEVLALSQVAARYDKLITIHTRSDSYGGLATLREAINIAKKTGARVHISHLVYQFGMGMMGAALHMIEAARNEGIDISVDSGLYSNFATAIGSAVFDEGCIEKWDCNYSSIIAGTGKYRGQRLTKEMFLEMRNEYPEDTGIGMVGRESEVFEALERTYMMVGTDAGTMYDGTIPGHPQDAGTYPKFFRTMVREQNRLTWLEAIKRCTYLPAERLGLVNKGRIKIGADADLVIFDPEIIEDKATYPCFGATDTRPEGIDYVIVSGNIVVKDKEVLNIKSGQIIKGKKQPFIWS